MNTRTSRQMKDNLGNCLREGGGQEEGHKVDLVYLTRLISKIYSLPLFFLTSQMLSGTSQINIGTTIPVSWT